MCGVKTYTIADRAKHGRISLTVIGKKKLVNVTLNPYTHFFKNENVLSPEEKKTKMEKYPTLPGGLISVKEFAAQHNMRTDRIYELIIANKLDAWHVDGITFVSNTLCKTLIRAKKR